MIGVGALMTYAVIPYRENKRNAAKLESDIAENDNLRRKIAKNLRTLELIEKQNEQRPESEVLEGLKSNAANNKDYKDSFDTLKKEVFNRQLLIRNMDRTNKAYFFVIGYLLLTAAAYGIDQNTKGDTLFEKFVDYSEIWTLITAPCVLLLSTCLQMYNDLEKEKLYTHTKELKQLNDGMLLGCSSVLFKAARRTLSTKEAVVSLRKEVRQLDHEINKLKKEREGLEVRQKHEKVQHQERQNKLAKLKKELELVKEKEDFDYPGDIQSAIDEISEKESQYSLKVADIRSQIRDREARIPSHEEALAEKCKQLDFLKGTLEFSLSAFNEDVSKESSHKGKEDDDEAPTNSSDEGEPLLWSVNRV